MTESPSEDAERRIIEEEGMSVDSYKQGIYDLEQKHMDLEGFREFVGFFSKRPTRPEDAQVLRIKAVRVSSGQSVPTDVQLLTPAGDPLENRSRKTEGRGTQIRDKEVHSMDDHLRHSCWSPALS